MKRNFLNIILILFVFMILLFSPKHVMASTLPFRAYTYDEWQFPTESPSGYEPTKIVFAPDLGIDILLNPEDLTVDIDNNIYILDSGNNRVIVTDQNFENVKIIDSFTFEEKESPLNSPLGIFVSKDKHIYIADTSNGRVVKTDLNGVILEEFTKPDSEIFPQEEEFRPVKVVVDAADTVYAISINSYNGALMYRNDGSFLGFFGSNRVEVSFKLIMDRFWKSLFSNRNREKFADYIPVEYSSFCIDNENFIYTCTKNSTSNINMIRKLNSLGVNILEKKVETSFQKGFGDLNPPRVDNRVLNTNFVDIAVDGNGFITAIDSERSRVFQYDENANLIFVFGGVGNQVGNFINPVAIDTIGNDILIMDKATNSITRFSRTEFGKTIHKATELYKEGYYVESIEPWKKVLKYNSNYNIGYVSIGKAEFELGNFKEAMDYFKIGNYVIGYNEAYKEYRTNMLRQNFPIFFLLLMFFIILIGVRKQKFMQNIKNSLTNKILSVNLLERAYSKKSILLDPIKVSMHPIEGFEDLFFEKRQSKYAAAILAFLMFVVVFIKRQFTGYIFNYDIRIEDLNLLLILFQSIGLMVLFSIINWSVCTLFDGNGKVKDIWVVITYSAIPYIFAIIFTTILSNFMLLEESIFLDYVIIIAQIYSVFLLIKGLQTIHEYRFIQSTFSIAATIVGMVIVAIILIVILSLVQQIFAFVVTIYKEYVLRYI